MTEIVQGVACCFCPSTCTCSCNTRKEPKFSSKQSTVLDGWKTPGTKAGREVEPVNRKHYGGEVTEFPPLFGAPVLNQKLKKSFLR